MSYRSGRSANARSPVESSAESGSEAIAGTAIAEPLCSSAFALRPKKSGNNDRALLACGESSGFRSAARNTVSPTGTPALPAGVTGLADTSPRVLYIQIRPHVQRILRAVLGETPPLELIHDVCADTVLSLARFRGDCAFLSWLYEVAVRHARKWIRTESRHRNILDDVHARATLSEVWPPDELVSAMRLADHLVAALDTLPERQRICFFLVHFENQTAASVAAQLGITSDAVRLNIHRARTRLRSFMEERLLSSR